MIVPVPRVSLMNTCLNPMSPREGHVNVKRVRPPSPAPICMSVISPFRVTTASMTPPVCSSSTSHTSSSIGSSRLPLSSHCLNSTAGGEMDSSNFSLRIVSISTPR